MKSQVLSAGETVAVDLRPYTWAYQRSIQMRCKCCGEFLSSLDALEAAARAGMPSATELCTDCQFKLSVVLAELGRSQEVQRGDLVVWASVGGGQVTRIVVGGAA